jgi:flagellar FliL protein
MAATAKAAQKDADLDVDDEAEVKRPKKKLPIRMLVIGAVALIAVGGGGYAAMHMFSGAKHEKVAPPPAKPAVFVTIPDVLVNLANSRADRPQYLKIKIVLEVADQEIAKQVQPLMPRVMDTFQTYLRELRASDLDGSVGLFRLREELTRRVNAVLAPARVKAVLFKEIVIQ